MATDQDFVEYVAEQASLGERLSYRKMFGEYAVYVDAKVVALACDNQLFVRPSAAVDALGLDLPTGPPYPGAREHPIADELLDSPERLQRLLLETSKHMPVPKPKKPRASRKQGGRGGKVGG